MLYKVIIHYVFLGSVIPKYLLVWTHGSCFILEEYGKIFSLFFGGSVKPGINIVAETGGSFFLLYFLN